MPKSLTFAVNQLELFFNATPLGTLADNDAAAPATNLYVSLHTADPGASGLQTANEVDYTGYLRAEVARTSAGWDVDTGTGVVSNVALIEWPLCTGGTSTATHWGIGLAGPTLTGGELLYRGEIDSPEGGLVINPSIRPQAAIGVVTITEVSASPA